jgi:response regulator NasT
MTTAAHRPLDSLETVIVADPDPVLRQSICEVMARAGYRVLAHADTVEEAGVLIRKLSPSAAVMGQGDTGKEALQTVQALRSAGKTAIVLLAPIPTVEWIRTARGAGVDILLGRPPREGDLVAAVEMACARRREARQLQAETDALRDRLEAGALVQKAKEVLMRRDQISDTEAYQRLRRQAERSDKPLRSIAEAVLLAARVAPMV